MSAGPDICIVSSQHPARNPRVVKEADLLAGAGLQVEVLTVASHAASLPLDRNLAAGRRWKLSYAVDLTGSAGGGKIRPVVRRLRTRIAREFNVRFAAESPDALGPVRPLLHAARRRPAKLFIAHSDAGLWVGHALVREGRRVAADFEDWHSEDLPPSARRRVPVRLLRAVEGGLLQRGAFTTTTSEALADALHACYGGTRPVVVPNAFPLQPDPRNDPPADPPAFFWFSQTLGPGRGLEEFLAAWDRSEAPSRCVLLGEPTPGYAAQLVALLSARRRASLSFLPLVPPDALPALIARHDIGLALEVSTIRSRDLTITNKILQYLNAGLAVVASDTAGQREVMTRAPDAGLIIRIGDPIATGRALDALSADRDRLSRGQRAARRLAEQHYCWEKTAPALLAAVEPALAPASSTAGAAPAR